MYTVLIVEDEPTIRDSLAECLPWQQWGFSAPATADNGRTALERMRRKTPDVVLTDIRMPAMDGITLLREIHEKHPALPVVILSGHDDFEYARQALSLGAYAYVLKLEIRSRLEEIMKKIRRDLDARQSDRARRSREKTALFRQVVIQTMLGHDPSMLSGFDGAAFGGLRYFLAVVRIERDPEHDQGRGKPVIPVEQYLEGRLRKFPCQHLILCLREDELVLLFYKKDGDPLPGSTLYGPLQSLSRELPLQGFAAGLRFVTAMGSDFHGYGELYEAYRQVHGRSLLFSPGSVSLLVDVSQPEVCPPADTLRETVSIERGLMDAMQLGSGRDVLSRLELWLQHWNQGDIINVVTFRQRCTWLFIALQQALEKGTPPDMTAELNTLSGLETVPGLCRWMRVHVACLLDGQDDAGDDTASRIRKLEQYLADHAMERITLEQMADKMHMNPSYLSTCFKKVTGASFGEYYGSLRMKKACELLQSGCSVNQVSDMMCYADPKSFRRMFKKHIGSSPGAVSRGE